MKNHEKLLILLLFFSLAACTGARKQVAEEKTTLFESITDSTIYPADLFLTQTLGGEYKKMHEAFSGELSDIRVDLIHYYTKDPDKNNVLASGIISYPANGNIKGIILAEHSTIGSNREAPSEAKYMLETVLTALGYMVISTDYIGYGTTAHLPHTYLHAGSTAQSSIDILLAVREHISKTGKNLTDTISIVGYSQGGASALAAQKMIESNFASDIHINNVIAGGGPYDLVSLFDDIKTGALEQSAFVPMAIIGLNYGDGLNLDLSRIFTSALLANYHEWIISKKYTLSEINAFLEKNCLLPDFFNNSGEIEKLRPSLIQNSLTEWTPRAPIRLIHGTDDTTVPFYCSQRAYDSFKEKGCAVELVPVPGADHTGAAIFYIMDVINHLN